MDHNVKNVPSDIFVIEEQCYFECTMILESAYNSSYFVRNDQFTTVESVKISLPSVMRLCNEFFDTNLLKMNCRMSRSINSHWSKKSC